MKEEVIDETQEKSKVKMGLFRTGDHEEKMEKLKWWVQYCNSG